MRFHSSILLGLCILALFLFAGIWIGCSPSQLVCDLRTLLNEARHAKALQRECREIMQCIEDRVRVLEDLEAGNLTLFEAAKRFERIGVSPASLQDGRVEIPRDEAGWCRKVLRSLKYHLAVSPSRYRRVFPPLLQVYWERFGEVPVDITIEPSFLEPAAQRN